MNKQCCISPDAEWLLTQVFDPSSSAHAVNAEGVCTEPTSFLCVKEDAPDDVVVSVPAPPPPPTSPKVTSNISIQKRCIIEGPVEIKPTRGPRRVTYKLV